MKRIPVMMIAIFVIQGCATPHGASTVNQSSASAGCNPGLGAAFGAVLGAAIAGKKHRTEGVVLGAGLGAMACIALNFNARQTKSAEQVHMEYINQHGNIPIPQPVLNRYQSQIATHERSANGQRAQIVSAIEIVADPRQPLVIEEEMVLERPDGKSTIARKLVNPATRSTGAYTTSFSTELPAGVIAGTYPIKMHLYVNNTLVARNQLALQVAGAANIGNRYASSTDACHISNAIDRFDPRLGREMPTDVLVTKPDSSA